MLLFVAALKSVLGGHIPHFMIQLQKTKNHHSHPAGWVTVWVGFIHYYKPESLNSENINSPRSVEDCFQAERTGANFRKPFK